MKKAISLLLTVILLMACFSAVAANAASYVYATGNMNVRSGAGTSYPSIGSVNKGSSLPYMNQYAYDNRGTVWYKVAFSNTYGWVSSVYGSLTDQAYGPTTYGGGGSGNDYGAYGGGSVYLTGDVNVRKGPGLNYGSIGTAYKGSTLTYLGNTSYDGRGIAWYNVSFKNTTGWVSSTYATLNGTSGGYSNSNYGCYVQATGGDTNLRTGPGLNYADIGTMHKGDVATYLCSTSTDARGIAWYYVQFEGKTGWVSSRYTTLY